MARFWAVFDLDGTVSDCTHRVHLARDRQWEEFHAACVNDPPHIGEVMIAQAWANAGGVVAYNTGRTENYRTHTRMWLQQHALPQGVLFMRAEGDRRRSTEAKLEGLHKIEEQMVRGDQLAFIMEDQDKLVAMWRQLGYTCLQPRPGAF